jgi:hypothetical protein
MMPVYSNSDMGSMAAPKKPCRRIMSADRADIGLDHAEGQFHGVLPPLAVRFDPLNRFRNRDALIRIKYSRSKSVQTGATINGTNIS